jgi:molybdenum storage protein
MVSCLLAKHGFVYLEAPFIVQLLPAMLAAARGAVFNGVPPYDLWEHPPEIGKIPPHRTDSGAYLVAEVFGARRMIFVKDVDGLYSCDPVVNGTKAEFIPKISVSALRARQLTTLPLDPIVLDLMQNAKLVKEVHIINGLHSGALTRALAGEPVGSTVYSD